MLEAEDFISPRGPLTERMFPGEDLEELAGEWLTQAQARTTSEAQQRAFVLMTAYAAIADRVMLEASQERKGDSMAARSDKQLAYWERMRDRYAREYQTLAGAGPGAVRPVRSVW